MLFKQPACDYVRFRETLETGKVAVENIVVKPEIHKVVGTVKVWIFPCFFKQTIQVLNIAFEKKVFVRVTQNHWKNYNDHPCVYQPSTSKIHDTFTFDLDMPRLNEKVRLRLLFFFNLVVQIHDIEFCVCYIANDAEHWDSNSGDNFKLHCEEPKPEKRIAYPSLFGR